MKVLYYIGMGTNKFGGLEKFNILLCEELRKLNIEPVIVYRRPIAEGPFKDFLMSNDIKYFCIFNSFSPTLEGKLRNAKQLAKIVAIEKPDIIHYNFANIVDIAFVKLLNPHLKYKSFYTVHMHPDLSNLRERLLLGGIIPFVNKILCVSEIVNADVKRYLKTQKSQTLYLGVSNNNNNKIDCRHKYGFKDSEVIISNVSFHSPIKGVDVMLRAIEHLKKIAPESPFRVIQIGGSPQKIYAEELNALIAACNLTGVVEMWGIRDDVDEILAASDIYCQTSRSEAIGLSFMEAAMATLPIVATKVGGIPEVAVEGVNAFLCKSEDYEDIGNKLKIMIEDVELREKMGNEGRIAAQRRFSIKRQVQTLVNLYQEYM